MRQAYRLEDMFNRLAKIGIDQNDARALRRIAMTLHRWYELECGDGNNYGSWCITRGKRELRHGQYNGGHGAHYVFLHDDDGAPYMEHHHYRGHVTYSKMPDRERGAHKRLAKIMTRYPGLRSYLQTDPRGAPLYILTSDISDDNYNRGIAVHK